MMLQPIIESFDAHPITTLKANDGSLWFLAKDLAPALGVGRNTVRMQVADLEPVDVRVNTIDTNKGSRRSTFVSESGALQIIVQSRKPAARRLRKWVCDLALKYASPSQFPSPQFPSPQSGPKFPSPQADMAQVLQLVCQMAQAQAQLVEQVAQLVNRFPFPFPSPRPGLPQPVQQPVPRSGDLVDLVVRFMSDRVCWEGNASSLVRELAKIDGDRLNPWELRNVHLTIARRLLVLSPTLWLSGILFETQLKNGARKLRLSRVRRQEVV